MRSGDEKGWKNLDRGNFSTVYHVVGCAPGSSKGQHFAVKDFRTPQLKWFDAEHKVLKLLGSHPRIVQLFDSFVDSATGHGCLVLEYCEGGSLQRKLESVIVERERSATSSLPASFSTPELIDWLKQLCSALAHLSAKGVVHNDLNLRNILLCADGSVKLADLGVARTLGLSGARGTRKGYSVHSSPELLSAGKTTTASDVYGLGCVALSLMLAMDPEKRTTFWAEEEKQKMADFFRHCEALYSAQLVDIVKSMLAQEPSARPSASQLFSELCALTAASASSGLKASLSSDRFASASTEQKRAKGNSSPRCSFDAFSCSWCP